MSPIRLKTRVISKGALPQIRPQTLPGNEQSIKNLNDPKLTTKNAIISKILAKETGRPTNNPRQKIKRDHVRIKTIQINLS